MATKAELYKRTATDIARAKTIKAAELPPPRITAETVEEPEPEVKGYKVQVYQKGRLVEGGRTKGWDDYSPAFATKEEAEEAAVRFSQI